MCDLTNPTAAMMNCPWQGDEDDEPHRDAGDSERERGEEDQRALDDLLDGLGAL
jgi:hypothetical protein